MHKGRYITLSQKINLHACIRIIASYYKVYIGYNIANDICVYCHHGAFPETHVYNPELTFLQVLL